MGTQQTPAFFFLPWLGLTMEFVELDFQKGRVAVWESSNCGWQKEDVKDKGQLSSWTHIQVMAADAGGGGGSKQTSVNRPGRPFCRAGAVWFTPARMACRQRHLPAHKVPCSGKIYRFIECVSRNMCRQTPQRVGSKSILYYCHLQHFSENDLQNTDLCDVTEGSSVSAKDSTESSLSVPFQTHSDDMLHTRG